MSSSTNLALGRPTWQSSTRDAWRSSNAVDGNRNPHVNDGSCMHTSGKVQMKPSSLLYTGMRPSCHLLATRKMVRKFRFCVTAATRPLCLHWTTRSVVVAQQVAQRRQSGSRTIANVAQGLRWSPNGGTVVATVIAHWTLLVCQRRYNGGRRTAKVLLKLIHNVHNSTHFLRGEQ